MEVKLKVEKGERKILRKIVFIFKNFRDFSFTGITMNENIEKMFKSIAEIARGKPLRKSDELELHRHYEINNISKPDTRYGSVMIESDQFAYFLPAQYRDIEIFPMNGKEDGYSFTIDAIRPTRNGAMTAKISFYHHLSKLV